MSHDNNYRLPIIPIRAGPRAKSEASLGKLSSRVIDAARLVVQRFGRTAMILETETPLTIQCAEMSTPPSTLEP